MAVTMSDPVSRPTPAPPDAPPVARRLIRVGVRQVRRDAAALRWAMFDARPGRDIVEVLHAVEPAADKHWSGWDEIAAAVQLASRQRPAVAVIGSPVHGSAEQVLQTESDQLALLVLGQDDPRMPYRRIAAHLRHTASCPVVCVPPGAEISEELPVTVVADDAQLGRQAWDFAVQYAQRHRTSVQLTRAWSAAHSGAPCPTDGSDAQAALDAERDRLQADYPSTPITTRLGLDRTWFETVRAQSSLLVVGRTTATRLCDLALGPMEAGSCPVAFIPDRWQPHS